LLPLLAEFTGLELPILDPIADEDPLLGLGPLVDAPALFPWLVISTSSPTWVLNLSVLPISVYVAPVWLSVSV